VPSGSRQPSSNGRRVSWRAYRKSGYKCIKTHGTYHGQMQFLDMPSQLQRMAMSAPCREEYSHRSFCSMLTNACGMKIRQKKKMSAQLPRTSTEFYCNSFTDLIDEMELRNWNMANTKSSGHNWQSRCTVKKYKSHGQEKRTKNSRQFLSLIIMIAFII